MQSIDKSVLINQSDHAMFDLIEKVENYPQFLPWCSNVIVHERTDTVTDATIQIRYFGLKTQFRTRNENHRPTQIILRFVEGPFRALYGSWNITALSETACKITFSLEYEFSNKAVEKIMGPIFDKITATFVDAFIKQANLTLS